jgi:hypothetical protein
MDMKGKAMGLQYWELIAFLALRRDARLRDVDFEAGKGATHARHPLLTVLRFLFGQK